MTLVWAVLTFGSILGAAYATYDTMSLRKVVALCAVTMLIKTIVVAVRMRALTHTPQVCP